MYWYRDQSNSGPPAIWFSPLTPQHPKLGKAIDCLTYISHKVLASSWLEPHRLPVAFLPLTNGLT